MAFFLMKMFRGCSPREKFATSIVSRHRLLKFVSIDKRKNCKAPKVVEGFESVVRFISEDCFPARKILVVSGVAVLIGS